MSAQVTIRRTQNLGLGEGLIGQYCQQLVDHGSDTVALVVPHATAVAAARRLAFEQLSHKGVPGLVDPRILSFPELARVILVANHHPFCELTSLQRELLVGDVLAEVRAEGALGKMATTYDRPGLIAACCSLLDELKRGRIEPGDFPSTAARLAPEERELHEAVGQVYARYQQRLQQSQLYDEAGLFWNALDLLEQGKRKPLEELRVLLLDGFEEFTTTQVLMLAELAKYVEQIEVRLWHDSERPHLAEKVVATAEELRDKLGAVLGDEEPPPSEESMDLDRVRQQVFRVEGAGIAEVDGSVQVLEVAGGAAGEAREIARQMKLLLTDREGLTPERVAVVVRSWDSGYERPLREALRRYGIPAEFGTGPKLSQIPAVRAALSVLDVLTGGWLRADVIKLINNGYVVRGPGLRAEAMEKIALDAGIIGGSLGEWRIGLGALAARLDEEHDQRAEVDAARGIEPESAAAEEMLDDDEGNCLRSRNMIQGQREKLREALALLDQLDSMLRPLENATDVTEAAGAFERIIRELQIPTRAEQGDENQAAQDLQGLEALAGVLREMAEAPEILGAGREADFPTFAVQLRGACDQVRCPRPATRRRGVQVLEASEARLESFDTVFVCGLREGLFPSRKRQDPIYGDEVRGRLQEGLPGLRPRQGGKNEEAFLFYGALACAERQVWLTFPLTEADGSPVLPSLYVDEVLRQWQGGAGHGGTVKLVQTRQQAQVIPGLEEACHYSEVLEALGWEPGLPEAWRGRRDDWWQRLEVPEGLPSAEEIHWLAAVEQERGEVEASRYAGYMQQEQIVDSLALAWGPDHLFSVSQLNCYAGCAMRFFFERLLRLEALPEPTEAVERVDLGRLMHRILAVFFQDRVGKEPLGEADLDQELRRLQALIEELTEGWGERVTGAEVVWQKTIESMKRDLEAVLRAEEAEGLAKRTPLGRQVMTVEQGYGDKQEFAVATQDGPVKLRGRIDRIDLNTGEGRGGFVLSDYKTGYGSTKGAVDEGLDLQLPVYAMATQELFSDHGEGIQRWGYYRICRPVGWMGASDDKESKEPGEPSTLNAIMQTARERMGEYVAGIRAGRFPGVPNAEVNPCRYCDFKGVCRQK
jgi:ATP-dependent helicase/DNAse subunit B